MPREIYEELYVRCYHCNCTVAFWPHEVHVSIRSNGDNESNINCPRCKKTIFTRYCRIASQHVGASL